MQGKIAVPEIGDDIPAHLEERPRDERRGVPIPWVAETTDNAGGEIISFAAVDARKSVRCVEERICGVCGEGLGYWMAFLGGPRSARARTYGDPPMHEDCAVAALTLCPHIAVRRHKRAPEHRLANSTAEIPDGWIGDKPDRWVLGITRDCRIVWNRGQPLIVAETFKRTRPFSYDDEGHIREE